MVPATRPAAISNWPSFLSRVCSIVLSIFSSFFANSFSLIPTLEKRLIVGSLLPMGHEVDGVIGDCAFGRTLFAASIFSLFSLSFLAISG